MHGSKLSDQFIQSDAVPSGTLLIPNKFGTLFELGVQRLETLEKLEIQYSQALAKPERQKNRILFSRFFIAAIRYIET